MRSLSLWLRTKSWTRIMLMALSYTGAMIAYRTGRIRIQIEIQ